MKNKINLKNLPEDKLIQAQALKVYFLLWGNKLKKPKLNSDDKLRLSPKAKEILIHFPYSLEIAKRKKSWIENKLKVPLKEIPLDQDQTLLKELVVGVIQVAIPGATLGKISRKPKLGVVLLEKEKFNLKDLLSVFYQFYRAEISNLLIHKIEPEALEWILEEGEIEIVKADSKNFKLLKEELRHKIISKENIILIPPDLNLEAVKYFYNLKEV